MQENQTPYCPECDDAPGYSEAVSRREFMRLAAIAAVGSSVTVPAVARANDAAKATKAEKPAEALIKELFSTLSADQKKEFVLPFDHGAEKGMPTRMGMYNGPIMAKTVGKYEKTQQELVLRIFKAICNGDEGYDKLSRKGHFDGTGSFQGCGALLFGEPKDGEKYAFVITSHHMTVRCDGNSEPGAAFGGPMYYGHSPNGYSPNNVWFYQTKSVLSVFDMLSEDQRKKAIVTGSPGEHASSVRFRKDMHPGIAYTGLSADQKNLVGTVMRTVLDPFRKEEGDEVMNIIKANGGMEKIHLAFYQDKGAGDGMRWHFWRLEGPGFVWNYRVLPHVHTYVNISSKI